MEVLLGFIDIQALKLEHDSTCYMKMKHSHLESPEIQIQTQIRSSICFESAVRVER